MPKPILVRMRTFRDTLRTCEARGVDTWSYLHGHEKPNYPPPALYQEVDIFWHRVVIWTLYVDYWTILTFHLEDRS